MADAFAHHETCGICHAAVCSHVIESARYAHAEMDRMRAELNTPHIVDFLEAVRIEALHQRERWGVEHDAGKTAADWFWLIGYLAGKALHSAIAGNTTKALHHTISTAAVCLNWHAHIAGVSTRMRPGLAEDDPRKGGIGG